MEGETLLDVYFDDTDYKKWRKLSTQLAYRLSWLQGRQVSCMNMLMMAGHSGKHQDSSSCTLCEFFLALKHHMEREAWPSKYPSCELCTLFSRMELERVKQLMTLGRTE